MLKDKIAYAHYELSNLKESYKNLVKEIKETFYEKEDFWVEDSPRKPRDESSKMQAAICLAQSNCPRISFDLHIRQAREWNKGKEDNWLDYWVVNQERFKDESGTPATIIIKKKNIKLLTEICRELWVKEVSASFRPNTTLGFQEWLEDTSVDKIFELMQESLNKHKDSRVYLVTDKNLYVKDIVVIFPKIARRFGIL